MDNEVLRWTFGDLFSKYLNPRQKFRLACANKAYFKFIYPKVIAQTTFLGIRSRKKKKKNKKRNEEGNEIVEETSIFAIPLSIYLLPPETKLKIPKKILQESLVYLIAKYQEKYASLSSATQTRILLNLLKRGAPVDTHVRGNFATIFHGQDQEVKLYPLHYAAISGNHEAARLLVQFGAILNSVSTHRELPIDYAAQLAHRGVARVIVEESAKIAEKNKKKQRTKKGEVETEQEREEEGAKGKIERLVDVILKMGRKMTMKKLAQDYSLLQISSYLGCSEVVIWFLEHVGNIYWKPTELGLSPMHLAAIGGHVEILRLLAKSSIWVTHNKHGIGFGALLSGGVWTFTPLHLAAHFGHTECVQFLLELPSAKSRTRAPGFKVPERNRSFYPSPDCTTPLDMAAKAGHKEIVEILLQNYGAKRLSSKNESITDSLVEMGQRAKCSRIPTLFLQAVSEKDRDMANFLWEYSYPFGPQYYTNFPTFLYRFSRDDLLRDYSPTSPVSYPIIEHHMGTIPLPTLPLPSPAQADVNYSFLGACFMGDMKLMLKSLEAHKLWETKRNDMTTALRLAAAQGHEEMVFKLFELEETPGCFSVRFSATGALPSACVSGHTHLVQKLLNMGAKIDDSNALLVACRYGQAGVVKVLLENGASIHHTTFLLHRLPSYYPLHYAAMIGSVEIIRELLKAGADVNKSDFSPYHQNPTITSSDWGACGVHRMLNFEPFTALHIALNNCHAEAVAELINAGALLKMEEDSLEATTLFFAATKGFSWVVKKCIEEGEYADVVFKHMLALASFYGHMDVVQVLMEKVNLTESWGGEVDPSVYAMLGGNIEILVMMMEKGAKVVGDWTKVTPMKVIRGIPGDSPHNREDVLGILLNAGKVDMINFLLGNGLDVNEEIGKLSLLGKALSENAPQKMIKFLVEKGACVEQKHLQAAYFKDTEILTFLLDNAQNHTAFFETSPGIKISHKMDQNAVIAYIARAGIGEGWTVHCSHLRHVQVYLEQGARISKRDFDVAFNIFDMHSLISTIVDFHRSSENATILLVEHFSETEFNAWFEKLAVELCAHYISAGEDKHALYPQIKHAWFLRFKTHEDLCAAKESARTCDLDVVFPLNEISATHEFGNFFYEKKVP